MHKSTDSAEVLEGVAVGFFDSDQQFLGDEFRLLDRYELQGVLVEALGQTEHFSHLAPKVAACHKSFRHWRCEENHDWAEAENSCSVRVCPHCAHRRSKILATRTQSFVVERMAGLRYVVLAERNSDSLEEGIASLWESWTRLRRSVRWKRKVTGCMVALEVTYNREDGTWHPHLNVLMEGEYFPFLELNKAWGEATSHRGRTSYIRAADAGTVFELIKYVTKISDLLDNPSALDEFLAASHGRRLIRTYGTFRGLAVLDEENPQGQCPDCGPERHVSIVRLGYVRPDQLSFDFERGCFRVARRSYRAIASDLQMAAGFYPDSAEPCHHLRPLTKLDKELAHFHELVKQFAATSREKEQ